VIENAEKGALAIGKPHRGHQLPPIQRDVTDNVVKKPSFFTRPAPRFF
jgi:hypothetical protein